jgi:hypothetical protein
LLRSLQEIQQDFVEEAKPKLGCGAKERRRRKKELPAAVVFPEHT